MASTHKIGRDLTGTGSLSKRGWRSGRDGSWSANQQYQHDIGAGMARNYPHRINTMANGAWQFFCMREHEWFEPGTPKPKEGESVKQWHLRLVYSRPEWAISKQALILCIREAGKEINNE